jgi:flagellar biosynthesis protein FlhB
MGKSFIMGLTDFINNNRQEIRTTLFLSTITTACLIAMFAFLPAMQSVWSYISAGFDTIMLGLSNVIEVIGNQIYESLAKLWMFVKAIHEFLSIFANGTVALGQDWKSAITEFFNLPFLEMVDSTTEAVGYFGSVVLLFIATSIAVYTIRKIVKDMISFYRNDDVVLMDMGYLSFMAIILSFLITLIPMIIMDIRSQKRMVTEDESNETK